MSAKVPDADLFLSEICEQPQALRDAAAGLGPQSDSVGRFAAAAAGRPLILTGMGSSFDACLAMASALARHGLLLSEFLER